MIVARSSRARPARERTGCAWRGARPAAASGQPRCSRRRARIDVQLGIGDNGEAVVLWWTDRELDAADPRAGEARDGGAGGTFGAPHRSRKCGGRRRSHRADGRAIASSDGTSLLSRSARRGAVRATVVIARDNTVGVRTSAALGSPAGRRSSGRARKSVARVARRATTGAFAAPVTLSPVPRRAGPFYNSQWYYLALAEPLHAHARARPRRRVRSALHASACSASTARSTLRSRAAACEVRAQVVGHRRTPPAPRALRRGTLARTTALAGRSCRCDGTVRIRVDYGSLNSQHHAPDADAAAQAPPDRGPHAIGLRAVRRGDTIRVTWRTDRRPRGQVGYTVFGSRQRNRTWTGDASTCAKEKRRQRVADAHATRRSRPWRCADAQSLDASARRRRACAARERLCRHARRDRAAGPARRRGLCARHRRAGRADRRHEDRHAVSHRDPRGLPFRAGARAR